MGASLMLGASDYYRALALVGGTPAGTVVRKLLDAADANIRAVAAETCRHAIFDEATVTALGNKATDPSARVRRVAIRALAVNANWRSEGAQKALIELATNPGKAVESIDRVGAVDAIGQAVRFQLKGVRQDPPMFRALVSLLDAKDDELRVMASNILAPIRDPGFRGDSGRTEQKAPSGGWPQWLNDITAKEAGYLKDYEVCGWGTARRAEAYPGNRGLQEPADLFCLGGAYLMGYNLATGERMPKKPAEAFRYTRQAAEQGYVPAEAALGMMYADGKGVQQNYAEAVTWWNKAAEGGHVLAASNLSMLYRGGSGFPANADASKKWAQF